MQRRHQESAFRLTFALPPFFQQTVLCHLQRHTGLGLDRSNHHLICRRHREHEECAVDDIGELTECSSTRRLPAQKWWDGWSHWPLPPSLLMRRALSCIAPCPAHSLWLLAPLACPRFRWLEDPLLAEDSVDLHRISHQVLSPAQRHWIPYPNSYDTPAKPAWSTPTLQYRSPRAPPNPLSIVISEF